MNRGANSDAIPNDLLYEILSRLPTKSIARFRCVSKLWESIIRRQDFTKLFYTRSSSNPRLLIGIQHDGEWSFFSTPQPQDHYGKSSLVVAADFHMKFSEDISPWYCSYASGLICFPNMRISKEYDDEVCAICNPSTGQYVILPPDLRTTHNSNYHCILGFDPIDKQFKVLVFNLTVNDKLVYHIVTLGTENLRWREIICPLTYGYCWGHICINGVLYYLAFDPNEEHDMIGSFDVRSEKFKSLNLNPDCFRNWSTQLINYKGKLGVINLADDYDGRFPLKLRMWVLEDVEKQEWTTNAYTLRAENKVVKYRQNIYVVGGTASGEIVLAKANVYNPFYVYYFNPEKNTLLCVEIQGVREEEDWSDIHRVYYFVDHVEGLLFDVMKTTYAATSISPPEQSTSTSSRENLQVRTVAHRKQDRHTFESVNKFDVLCLLEDD